MNVEKKLNSLKEYIRSKSITESEEIVKKAEAQAESITKEYKEKAQRAYEEIIQEAKRNVAEYERREIAQLRARSSKMILDAKNDILKSALNELKETMYSLPANEKYDSILEKLLKEAIETLKEKEVVVYSREEDMKKVAEMSEKLKKELKVDIILSDEPVKIIGGVIVSTKDKRIVVENTLENKFEEMKEKFLSLLFSTLNAGG